MDRVDGLKRLSTVLKKAPQVGAFFVAAIYLSMMPATGLAAGYCSAPSGLPLVAVKRVVDGDTLHLRDGRKIRLIGINTPELGPPAQPFARAARSRLAELIKASGNRVMIETGLQVKDNHGRTLVHAYNQKGDNLEARLLTEGLGFSVVMAPNVKLRECHLAAERVARNARLGLWRQTPVQSASKLQRGGFAILSGTAGKVVRNRGGTWIEMPGSLILRVSPEHLKYFSSVDLLRLEGRRIEVRGWVVERGGSARRPAGARWLLSLTDIGMLDVNPFAPAS